jgi:hypothetical protein
MGLKTESTDGLSHGNAQEYRQRKPVDGKIFVPQDSYVAIGRKFGESPSSGGNDSNNVAAGNDLGV